MKLFRKLGLVSAFALVFAACGDDDPVNPSNNNDYFPRTQGHYRVYDNYSIDSETNEPALEGRDSVVATGTVTKDGKSATEYTTYEWDTESSQYVASEVKQHYYMENGKLYTYSDMIARLITTSELPFPIPIEIPDQWILVADANASAEWQILNQTIPQFTQKIGGFDIVFNLSLKVNGSKMASENVTVSGTEFNSAKKFATEFMITGTATTLLGPVDINFGGELHSWYADNVGLIKSHMAPIEIALPGSDPIMIDGRQSLIVNYPVVEPVK